MDTMLHSDPPTIEYLDGRAYPKVSPRTGHSLVQGAMLALLRASAGRRGAVGPELRCYPAAAKRTQTSLVPDVAFVSRERLRALHDGEEREKPPFSPDVVVEVRSPSEDLRFLRKKIERYLATGALLVLDVDPQSRTISAHSHEGVTQFTQDMRFTHARVPWLTFDVREVFCDLDEYGL